MSMVTCLTLFGLRVRDHRQSSSLTAMAQRVGYGLRSAGPFLALELFHRLPAADLQRCPERPSRDSVNPYAAINDPLGQALGEVGDPGLGQRIVDDILRRVIGIDRRGIHDGRAFGHYGHRCFGQPEQSVEVGFKRLVELLVRDVQDRVVAVLATGAVDENVQAAKGGVSILHQASAKPGVAQVAGQCHSLSVGVGNEVDDLASIGLFIGQIVDRHIGTFSRESDSSGPAQAGIATCDERTTACELSATAIAGFPMIWTRVHLACQPWPWLLLFNERRLRVEIHDKYVLVNIPNGTAKTLILKSSVQR